MFAIDDSISTTMFNSFSNFIIIWYIIDDNDQFSEYQSLRPTILKAELEFFPPEKSKAELEFLQPEKSVELDITKIETIKSHKRIGYVIPNNTLKFCEIIELLKKKKQKIYF